MIKHNYRFVVVARTRIVHIEGIYGRTACRPTLIINYMDPAKIGMTDPTVIPQVARICIHCNAIAKANGIDLNKLRATK